MSSERFLDDKSLKKLDRQLQQLIDREGMDRKTLDIVFDKSTLLTLEKLISDRIIDVLDFPISTGKEAHVFRAITPDDQYVAVKVYRTQTLSFKKISTYIVGDPRFQPQRKSHRGFVYDWAKKEFHNLQLLQQAQVTAPRPIKQQNNVVVMEYIGSPQCPAPLLKDTPLSQPKKIYDLLVTYLHRMYTQVKLVHADFSQYNILMHDTSTPYVIDLAQGVLRDHPHAHEFLQRDIHNILQFFKKYDVTADETKVYNSIVGKG